MLNHTFGHVDNGRLEGSRRNAEHLSHARVVHLDSGRARVVWVALAGNAVAFGGELGAQNISPLLHRNPVARRCYDVSLAGRLGQQCRSNVRLSNVSVLSFDQSNYESHIVPHFYIITNFST